MSTFSVKVHKLIIAEHTNADSLEIAKIGDYLSIVRKGQYRTGILAAYLPEQSIVPQNILEQLDMWDKENNKGKLSGSMGNRIKAIRLRQVLSQGIVYPAKQDWVEGQDVTKELGITKYEPEIPTYLSGEVYNAGPNIIPKFDIENIKNYPDVLQDGEPVVVTEKLHGSACLVGILPISMDDDKHYLGRFIVASKGLGGKGLAFKHNDANKNNVYLRTLHEQGIFDKMSYFLTWPTPVFLLGEIFGKGVQDLTYGQQKPIFKCFNIRVGEGDNIPYPYYMDEEQLQHTLDMINVPRVPVLYRGPYGKEIVNQYTDGKETISGTESNIREGIVITPQVERRDLTIGRVILKSVSEAYLLRKGNVTEYQ